MPKKYLIQNGTLLSIVSGGERRADILVENGVIAAIGQALPVDGAEVIDASGRMVSTGWLDAHCHFARRGGELSIDPVEDILRQGVTHAVDMGTLGPENYAELRSGFRDASDLGAMAYLNIARLGVLGSAKPIDFEGPEDIDPGLVENVADQYRSELLGLKARIDEKFCFDPVYVMDMLRSLGDRLEMPIAVHAPRSLIGIETLLSYLKEGDVLCHTLAGNSKVMDILDERGNIRDCVKAARDRGVIFDLSHGTNAYSYDTAEAAWQAGFFPDTISSDLHARNVKGPVYSLGTVLTKMRGLTGMPWWQLLNKAVAEPVRLQHIPGKAVELQVGGKADLTVFQIEKGSYELLDSKKASRVFTEQITPVYTCVGERVYPCRSR